MSRRLIFLLPGLAALAVAVWPRDAQAPAGPHLVAAPAAQVVPFTLVLRLPGAALMQRDQAAAARSGSAGFGRVIGAVAFGRRYGLSTASLRRVIRVLRAGGVQVTDAYPQRTALAVRASVGAVQRLFAVRIEAGRGADGRAFRTVAGRALIPAALRGAVTGVLGLDTRPRWHTADVPGGGLTSATVARAYDLDRLRGQGITGQGERVAVISFSDLDHGDPAVFANRFHLAGPGPRYVSVQGGTGDLSGFNEANLDIDVIRSTAPGAQILFYEADGSSAGFAAVLNQIVQDHSADVVSFSWGQCEAAVDPTERAADRAAVASARAAGISVFSASGDFGAYDCQDGDLTDHSLSVDWPAASPDVVAVGGTRLNLRADGSYAGESAWSDTLSLRGSGGGFAATDPRPAWQAAPGVLGSYSTGARELPDVAADADAGTGWDFYAAGHYGEAGGTSAAAPFWAAATVLMAQYAARHGVPRLGFIDPMLYALAGGHPRRPPFHDITRGTNRFYPAGPGWDPATGLGSPDVYNLARDAVDYLRRHPAPSR